MKMIYLFIGGTKSNTSVSKKIANQISEFNNQGIKTIGWFFDETNDNSTHHSIEYKQLKPYNRKHRLFHKHFQAKNSIKQIIEALEKKEFDCLFIRHTSPNSCYFKLLTKHAEKTFLYLPSNAISEVFQERKANKQHSFASFLIGWFEYFVFTYSLHYFLFWFILPKLKGVVAFTPEFEKIVRKKTFGRCHTIYNRDGADCINVSTRKYIGGGKPYKLVFLKGSSMQQPWSGLDRLVKSIQARPDLDIQLFIAGFVYDKENYNLPFIKLTGKLDNEALQNLINEVDIGVNNLANYLINFNETTNLKSRDYFARGLPFIQANSIPDIDGTAGEQFYLKLPNNNSLIDLDIVINFIEKMRTNINHPIEMRKFAEEHLSWNKTVGELSNSIKESMKIN